MSSGADSLEPGATDLETDGSGQKGTRRILLGATGVGLFACAGILFLLYGLGSRPAGLDLRFLPAVNASLNGLAALLLVAGRLAIARENEVLHRRLMIGALTASSLFLVGYLAYHAVHGDTPYPADAPFRVAYLVLLASHVLSSILVLPLVLAAVTLAATGRRKAHRAVARFAWPLWLYVSVTGIAVFTSLRLAGA